MAWKKTVNEKSLQAKERRQQMLAEEKMRQQQVAEDKYWEDNDKLAQAKLARKRANEEKQQRMSERKTENKIIYEEESRSMASRQLKNEGGGIKKMSRAQIAAKILSSVKEAEKKREEEGDDSAVDVSGPSIETFGHEINAGIGMSIQGSGLDAAVEASTQLSLETKDQTIIPFQTFLAQRLEEIKLENPNLKFSQHQQIAFKEWQKYADQIASRRRQ